jgi:hypothetical protein
METEVNINWNRFLEDDVFGAVFPVNSYIRKAQ